MRSIALLFLMACNGDPSPTYFEDIKPLVDARCGSCHLEGGIGPFPLGTFEEVHAVREMVVDSVVSRRMPPWTAADGVRDYTGDPSFSDEEIALFQQWLDGDAPEGDASLEGPALPALTVELPRVDLTIDMPEPYSPFPSLDDDYRCFLIEWPESGTRYVTGFEVHPDNASVVHHVAAFLIRPDSLAGPGVLEDFRAFDANEAGPGYTCFGGPSGSEDVQVPVQQIAQWVPGSGAVMFPEGTGIPIPEDSIVVLQLHYNTLAWDGRPDQSTVDLVIADEVDRIGSFAPFLNPLWPLGEMVLPAGEATDQTYEADPRPFFELLNGDLDLTNGFDIFASMMHMHTLGSGAEVMVKRANGDEEVLVRVEDYDFDWQFTYRFSEPTVFEPGDTMHLTCNFDNDRPEDVNWGEGSDEEMCVANLFIAPR